MAGSDHTTPPKRYITLEGLYVRIKGIEKNVDRIETEVKEKVGSKGLDKELKWIKKELKETDDLAAEAKKKAETPYSCVKEGDFNAMTSSIDALNKTTEAQWKALDKHRAAAETQATNFVKQATNYSRIGWIVIAFIIGSAFVLGGYLMTMKDDIVDLKDKVHGVQIEQRRNGYVKKEEITEALKAAVEDIKQNGSEVE